MAEQQDTLRARILDEAEFTKIEDALIAQAPPGLSEADFERWITPRLDQAVAQAEYGPPKVEGSALGRGAGGAAEFLNPVSIAKGIWNALPIPQALGGAGVIEGPANTLGSIAMSHVDQAKKAGQAFGEGRFGEGLAHTAATAIPVLGPVAAGVGEEIAETGDIARGVGKGLALALPGVARPVASAARRALPSNVRGRVADRLQAGAESRVVDTLTPKGKSKANVQAGRDMAQHADDVTAMLAEDGAAWSAEGLRPKVQARLAEAEAVSDAAADARLAAAAHPTKPLIDALTTKRRALMAEAVDASRPVRAAGERGALSEVPLGRDVTPAPNAARAAVLDKVIADLKALGPVTRYEPIRRIRQAYDQQAKARYNAAVTPNFEQVKGAQLGAADVTGTLREHLGTWDEGTKAANAGYHVWRTVDDIMEMASDQARVSPKVGRTIVARAAAVLFGGAQGGLAGAATGAVLAPSIEALLSSSTTKLQTARLLKRLSSAMKRGDRAGVEIATTSLKALAKKYAPVSVSATPPMLAAPAPAGQP